MPPPLLFDPGIANFERLAYTREQIYQILPHRYEFAQLDGIYHLDLETGRAVAYRDVRADEFWCRGHIPGRPIFPGILMIESAAHIASFVAHKYIDYGDRFLGFGGVDKVKFRDAVLPGCRLIILARAIEIKYRRTVCTTQGLVDGKMVFEAEITGMPI